MSHLTAAELQMFDVATMVMAEGKASSLAIRGLKWYGRMLKQSFAQGQSFGKELMGEKPPLVDPSVMRKYARKRGAPKAIKRRRAKPVPQQTQRYQVARVSRQQPMLPQQPQLQQDPSHGIQLGQMLAVISQQLSMTLNIPQQEVANALMRLAMKSPLVGR